MNGVMLFELATFVLCLFVVRRLQSFLGRAFSRAYLRSELANPDFWRLS